MPNWCQNELVITGRDEHVRDLVNKVHQPATENQGEDHFSFNKIAPEPETIDTTKLPPTPFEHIEDWYRWRLHHWGVKWVAEAGPPDIGFQKAVYNFDTPWGPPIPIVEAVSKQFPELTFELVYAEWGMDFGGRCRYQNGKLLDEEEGTAEAYSDNAYY